LYGASNPQSKRKGWEIFINTLKMLDKSKYYLLIFGNFWSNKILDEIGIEYKSLGFVYDKETLNSVYSSADVFIASSIQDGWPKTFAEAMYCNTPVICFSKTSIAEIVDHKINGYVVENFNSEKLKDGIDWLVENIENKNLKFENTKNKIINYGSEKIAKKYIELYKDILKKN
jgi:glycosyltransferase involved in cell wall biosynthesis